jgi:superfamily II DNA or RNA helicase
MAEHIDGGTPIDERDAILKGLANGRVELVTNCAVLTEGFDCPDVGCLILARPTKSLGLFRQMIGRALRPTPGKKNAIILDHSGSVFVHGLPEDDIAWTLDVDNRAVNRTHAARGAQTGLGAVLVDCPECHAVRMRGKQCVVCGWVPRTRGVAVDVIDGDLGLVQRDRRVLPTYTSEAERRLFYQQLLFIVHQRGYSPGWAFHKYREKFNETPPRHWRSLPPVEPELHVLAWVRSRQIAYAKAQAKARGAA